jgi:citrate lyase subunit beta/citryl-CoA lyase
VASEIAGVVVPKLESPEQLDVASSVLADAGLGHLHVLAGLESALGVERARELLRPPVAVAYFGAEDFIADMGGVRTPESTEVVYARSRVALAARVAGVPALDQVVTQLDAEDHFLADAALGRAIGYRGKLCIHPAQVTLANRAFSSSPEEIERAQRLLAAYEEAVARGEAAIAFDGQMVDEPVARHARAVLAAADALAPGPL